MRRDGVWRRVLAWMAFAALRLVGRTLRLRAAPAPAAEADATPRRRVLLAFEHGRQFALLAWFDRMRGKRIALLSSTSDDGRLQAGILRRLGYRVVLGSSSRRGAAALVGLVRAVRDDGYDAALAVDGPRGPRGSVKPGIAWLASRTGAEIVPVSAAAAPAHVFARSWCAYRLPWPWARGRVAFGAPITVARGAGEAEIGRACAEVGAALARLGAEVDAAAGLAPVVPAARDVLDWTG
ncbi:MAG TPA: DUF374 domain-containing protein [Myxococcota bacterium]|jgi:hypothetical protein|nr:DUF374 domain-containing protein [Myxococcota bacterium]